MLSFGKRLKKARENKGFTQAQVMKITGISDKSLSRYENNASAPDPNTILDLAQLYGVSADYLLGNTPASPSAIAARIKRCREELGISGEELAKAIGKAKTTVYRYETGAIEKVPAAIIKDVARALRVTPEYLMGYEVPFPLSSEEQEIITRYRNNPSLQPAIKKLLDMHG